MNISKIGGQIGAEVTGVNLNNLTDSEFLAIEAAFAEYLVLSFREQNITPKSLVALTHRFGGPGHTPYLTGMDDYPDVVPVIKEASEQSPHTFGAGWHTDFTFQKTPPSRTLLYAVDTPQSGGDTLYTNLYLAYDSLSVGMKAALEKLTAVHSAVRSYGPSATLKDHMENMTISNDEREPDIMEHPVISEHPITHKPVLWVNPTYTIRFSEMTEDESRPLLDYLNQHAISPSFGCRVKWARGTLTMWDNRCTQHCATSDYAGHRREMWRTTVCGESPVRYQNN
ncbi:MAG: taurine dioxygenase [Candidatus Azotimanducaceae bacterium]|jgi:taurine dioxygenase